MWSSTWSFEMTSITSRAFILQSFNIGIWINRQFLAWRLQEATIKTTLNVMDNSTHSINQAFPQFRQILDDGAQSFSYCTPLKGAHSIEIHMSKYLCYRQLTHFCSLMAQHHSMNLQTITGSVKPKHLTHVHSLVA